MTEQHPSSRLPITRERYDELANAGLSDGQITQLAAAGITASDHLIKVATAATVSASQINALGAPPAPMNPRGITYTNRAAQRAARKKERRK